MMSDDWWDEEDEDAPALETTAMVACPYCGEMTELVLDPGVESDTGVTEAQEYIEDCEVCCRPRWIRVQWFEGQPQVEIRTEDEA